MKESILRECGMKIRMSWRGQGLRIILTPLDGHCRRDRREVDLGKSEGSFRGRWFTAGAAARIRSHDASGAVGGPDESRFWRPGRIVRVDTSDALGDFLVIPRF